MTAKLRQILFSVCAIVLAAIFIWLTLRQTDFQVLKQAASEANYIWFLLSMAISIFSYWLRAKRWQLLSEPIGHPFSAKAGFWAISFAYFMNLTIPRSGEIARATSLYKMEKVPVDKSLGIVVLERVIDVLFLGFFFLLTFLFNADTLTSFLSMSEGKSYDKFIYAGVAFIVLVTGIYLIRNQLKKLPFFQKIAEFIKGILIGVQSIMHLKKRGLFIFYSFAIWICYFFMTYLVFFAFPATSHFGLAEGFFLIVAGALGMILPAVGGLGYPYVMSLAFTAMYISNGQSGDEGKMVGNYFGLLLYFAQVISILIFGILAFYFMPRISKS